MNNDNRELLDLLTHVLHTNWSGGYQKCPYCREAFIKYGHASDCQLAKHINRLVPLVDNTRSDIQRFQPSEENPPYLSV